MGLPHIVQYFEKSINSTSTKYYQPTSEYTIFLKSIISTSVATEMRVASLILYSVLKVY
jgi:hypothetical protein